MKIILPQQKEPYIIKNLLLSLGPKYKVRFKNTSDVACNSLCNYQVVQMMKCCVSCDRLYIPAMWQVFLSTQQRKFIIYATGVKLNP